MLIFGPELTNDMRSRDGFEHEGGAWRPCGLSFANHTGRAVHLAGAELRRSGAHCIAVRVGAGGAPSWLATALSRGASRRAGDGFLFCQPAAPRFHYLGNASIVSDSKAAEAGCTKRFKCDAIIFCAREDVAGRAAGGVGLPRKPQWFSR